MLLRAIAAVTIFLCAFLCVMRAAGAHSWYEARCCSDKDCAPLPDDAVQVVPGGYVLKSSGEFIPEKDTRPGQDDQFHICINALTNTRLCFYRKFNGS